MAYKPTGRVNGRPLHDPALGKRVHVPCRLNTATRDQVQALAEASGRSLSQEIEAIVRAYLGRSD